MKIDSIHNLWRPNVSVNSNSGSSNNNNNQDSYPLCCSNRFVAIATILRGMMEIVERRWIDDWWWCATYPLMKPNETKISSLICSCWFFAYIHCGMYWMASQMTRISGRRTESCHEYDVIIKWLKNVTQKANQVGVPTLPPKKRESNSGAKIGYHHSTAYCKSKRVDTKRCRVRRRRHTETIFLIIVCFKIDWPCTLVSHTLLPTNSTTLH